MPAQENTPDGGPYATAPSAHGAASTLQGVDIARTRAALRARITPAWFGPAAAAVLIVPRAVDFWGNGRGFATLLSLLLSLAGLVVIRILIRAGQRSSGVMVTESWAARVKRNRATSLPVFAAMGLTWLVCWQLGADGPTTRLAAFTVGGLGVWAASLWRNAAIRQQLEDLA
ncbi:hypothetical protein [Streptomyces pinistramenti]|uniref:hypothetical protein n=1 Tax=Streptomyces pinistramenti TaxID=2884812 RepID=UPI001D09105F|nr:hypothetical protein [Streptomyces pinistramenti]MCB5911664.1 hypothetical protein [Streptomyces pinistramenti]